MKLLVSVVNKTEALEAIKGRANIIDVKNPKEGSLGANFPRVIRQVKEIVPNNVEVSATIGDLPNLPGTASLAALGATTSGADYVKAGLFGVKTSVEATILMKEVCMAVRDYSDASKVIAAGYADFKNVGCVNPLKLPPIAYKAKADGVMIDVKIKDSESKLFNFLDDKELKKFVEEAHDFNLIAALAGSLDTQDLPRLYDLGADVIGVRKAVCDKRDRLKGLVQRKAVLEFAKEISSYERTAK
ncbi:MAG: (5-formylfuran-3-yl)methyl phosphate synthase [Candidatus Bathyarchaeota archaeon]|nr:(5-formylfuran-3-yl)methyl phosphate synthase [Candidatus Bathyarchaeota archaeon]